MSTIEPKAALIASYHEEYRCLAGWWKHHTLTTEQNEGLMSILGRMRDALKAYDAAKPDPALSMNWPEQKPEAQP